MSGHIPLAHKPDKVVLQPSKPRLNKKAVKPPQIYIIFKLQPCVNNKNAFLSHIGNILENATDACKEVEDDRFINLNTTYKTSTNGTPSLTLIVKNNYGTEPSESDTGIFHSTKHAGDGIGISSVKRTAKKYDGACTFTHKDGTFTVSVVLYGPAEN